MHVLLSNSFEDDIPFIPSAYGEMEVKYVRIYTRDCDWWEGDVLISEDTHRSWGGNFNTITVADGKTLTLENATLEFAENGYINLGQGSRLILKNTTLTSCNSEGKWQGVYAANWNSEVFMENNTQIENANYGVCLAPPSSWFWGFYPFNSKLTMDNSRIVNCNTGIFSTGNLTESIITNNSSLRDNDTGIRLLASKGPRINGTSFINNTEAIHSYDSYINVEDNNYFSGGETGISIEGSFPLSSRVGIGKQGFGHNIFENMDMGVDCSMGDSELEINISNNEFSNINNVFAYPILMYGNNNYVIDHNTFRNNMFGIIAAWTGENFNRNSCNLFDNISGVDNGYMLDNHNSTFLSNEFTGIHGTNFSLISATMSNNIGSNDVAAGNCFSDNSIDIYTAGAFASGPGPSFNYYYKSGNANNCEEPTNVGNYVKVPTFSNPFDCQGNKGIFNLIDPDSDGKNGFVYDTSAGANANKFVGHISYAAILGKISTYRDSLIGLGGDDPYTYADESIGQGTSMRQLMAEKLEQWIRYAVLRGIDDNNFGFAEQVLSPLNKWRWKAQYFGVKMLQAKYAEAQSILIAMPANTLDEQYFKTVQGINIRFMSDTSETNPITGSDITTLEVIANSHEPSSAYARSLYRLLSGNKIQFEMPILNQPTPLSRINSSIQDNAHTIIFPNPNNGEFGLISSKNIRAIKIINSIGMDQRFSANSSYSKIQLIGSKPGIYLITVFYDDGTSEICKIVKN